jgi:hypothetical protein
MIVPPLAKTLAPIFSRPWLESYGSIQIDLQNSSKTAMVQMTRASWDQHGSHTERE